MGIQIRLDDGIGRLTLDAPPLNILTSALMGELRAGLAGMEREGVRALVLDAIGPHFSAGASVEEHLPPHFETMIPKFIELFRALHDFPLPVIAAVHGRCLGGAFELVSAADIVIVAKSASFGVPEIRLGVFPPAATALLPLLVGPSCAAELVFTGDTIDAARAAQVGFAHRVVPDERLEAEAVELAQRIARNSAAALRVAKRALRARTENGTDYALEFAASLYINELMKTRDALEGLRAFTEKRSPAWSHA